MYSNAALTQLRRNYVTYVKTYVTYVELRVINTLFSLRNLRELRNVQRNCDIVFINGATPLPGMRHVQPTATYEN